MMSALRGEGVYPVRKFFGQGERGVLQIRTSALFAQKPSNFSKFMVCPHGQGRRGVCPVRTFCGQGGGGSIFCDFVPTSFMDGP